MDMELAFYNIGIVSSVLICLLKWGVLDYYQARWERPWLPAAGCYFCLGFWLTILNFTAAQIWAGWITPSRAIEIVLYGFVSAPFINMIVGYARGQVRRGDDPEGL